MSALGRKLPFPLQKWHHTLDRWRDDIEELAAGVSIADGTGWVPLDDDNVLTGLKTLAAKSDAAGLPLLDFHERAARLNFAFVLAVGSKRTPDFELQVACKPRLIRYRSADCWGSRTTRALERRDPSGSAFAAHHHFVLRA